MKQIKYIKSEKFFIKEYKDGIIVAFKNIGDNSPSYAYQIHQMVSKSFGVDLFVSDIIESISGTNRHIDSIKDSLFIYVKNGVSISACGISLCPNKDYIEVKYNSEDVLSIKSKQPNKFWRVCISSIICIICILGYNITINDDKTNKKDIIIEPKTESQTEIPTKEGKKDCNVNANDVMVDKTEEATPIITNDTNMATEFAEGYIENENNVSTSELILTTKRQSNSNIKNQQTVKKHLEGRQSSVEHTKRKQDREEAEKSRQRKHLEAKANEYIRIADQAYSNYVDSFNESECIVALTNYKKALDLNKEHGLFLVSKREKIEQRINVIEKELK